jgi:SSS family solute:Na+ symporter
MNVETIDWAIIAGFVGLVTWIAIFTNRRTNSVAGFLSAERCAGRYLLTIAGGMTFFTAAGIVAGFEQNYRSGITFLWWGLMGIPINMILAMSGWVTYRYRQTRALTMAQFLEVRYSRNFRVFAGFMAFFSGILNCAIMPMVTSQLLMYFMGLPDTFSVLGLPISTFHFIMFLLVAGAVILATSGGQITIMLTDFFIGNIANITSIVIIGFVLYTVGLGPLLETLFQSEFRDVSMNPEGLESLRRVEGASMLNPFKIGDLPHFGFLYVLLYYFIIVMQTGVWQGGAGYMTAAKTPHESKMGNVLGQWRWLIFQVAAPILPIFVYVVFWNPDFAHLREPIVQAVSQISEPYTQTRMFVPVALGQLLPAGLLGLLVIYFIGASISTDDSYYHSWGSTLLQDVIMPFRKKPFTQEEHMRYLRWSIIAVGVIAFAFSSVWTLKEYITMWFAITGSIYVGGACCAIIGGLYWSKGTTAGAWAGMITGSFLSVGGIVLRQLVPDLAIGEQPINGQHIGAFSIVVAITVYAGVSLLTCKKNYNMDKLLHRGKYADPEDAVPEVEAQDKARPSFIARVFGITKEFTRWDKIVFALVYTWLGALTLALIVGTTINVTTEISSESWKWWMGSVQLPVMITVATIMTIWFVIGSCRDAGQLFKDLATREVHEDDDGFVKKSNDDT